MAKTERDLNDKKQRVAFWNEQAAEVLKGRRIVEAGYCEDPEWEFALYFKLDNGTTVFVSRDDEGNGPGSLFIEGETEVECLPRLF